jgi:xanthine dehydrogenase accessory factor
MLAAADAVLGTIGCGHLELQALKRARALSAQDDFAPETQRIALGPSLRQCCGGALVLRYTRLAADPASHWQGPPPRFVLHLFGARHVGRAIVNLLAAVPCHVRWVDECEGEFPIVALPPHIGRVCAEPVQAEVAAASACDAYPVLMHSHDLDLAGTREILARGDFGFFGLIGSATKRAKFARRLAERGLASELVARNSWPIGLPRLRGKQPGVIAVAAVAAVAQLLLAHPG